MAAGACQQLQGAVTGVRHASAAEPFTVPHAEALEIVSAEDLAYRLAIGFPPSYGAADRAYPVLYVLDADVWFCTVLETARVRARSGEVGEIVVVGIGYPLGTSFGEWSARRMYDFTAEGWDLDSAAAQQIQAVMEGLGETLELGGVESFLRFMTDVVQPLVADRYRIDQADQAILGHSAGGNLVGHALFTAPGAFTKYLAGSPAFVLSGWGVLRLAQEYAQSHDDLEAVVYLAAASAEAQQFASSEIVSGTARLTEALQQRGYPGLHLTSEFIAGRTHPSVFTEALQRGLEICWPGSPSQLDASRWQSDYLRG
jgi:predicted alpha/beta superfamily hydrolase